MAEFFIQIEQETLPLPSERTLTIVLLSTAEKCFDIWGILKMASVKSVDPRIIVSAEITLLDLDLNFYCWDFQNWSWY